MEQRLEGSDTLAGEAIEMIRFDLRTNLTSALLQHLETVKSLSSVVPKTEFSGHWGQMQAAMGTILREHFFPLVTIASRDLSCSNPADWADKFCHSVLVEVMARKIVLNEENIEIIDRSIIDLIIDAYEDEQFSREELLTDFYVEIRCVLAKARDESVLALAQGLKPKEKPTQEENAEKLTPKPKPSQFQAAATTLRLVDLQEPRARNRNVYEFYPYLKQAIDAARSYVDANVKSNHKVAILAVEKQFPILKGIDSEEFKYVVGRLSLHEATIGVLRRRTRLSPETILRFVRGLTQR